MKEKHREVGWAAHRSDGVESRRLPIRECRSRVENGPAAAARVEAEHRRRVDGEPLPADADALHVHVVVGWVLLVSDDGRVLHGAGAFPRPEAAAAGLVGRADRGRCRSGILPGSGVSSTRRGGVAAERDGARGGGRGGEWHQAVGKGVGDGGLELRVEGERALAESHEPAGAWKRAFVVVAATDRNLVGDGRTWPKEEAISSVQDWSPHMSFIFFSNFSLLVEGMVRIQDVNPRI